jgi:YHS domain-containing protein
LTCFTHIHQENLMKRKISRGASSVLIVALLGLLGQGVTAISAASKETAVRSSQAMEADTSGLNGLNGEDRAAAEKQKTCPVSGELLGSMGTPVKVEAKGRTVFLCCGGCKKKFFADPDKYIKKIDEKK